MHIALWVVVIALAIVNTVVCFRVLRSASYVPSQKFGQILMIWLVPVVGATLVWNFLREETTTRFTTDLADRFGNDDGDLRYEKGEVESGDSSGGD